MMWTTRVRIAVSAILATGVVVGAAFGSIGAVYAWMLLGLQIAGIPLLFAATETETLPPDCRVPRNRFLALLSAPWLPGGARGALFLILHLGLAFASVWLARACFGEPTTRVFHMGVTCLFATIYVLLPCAVVSPLLARRTWSRRMRIIIPIFMSSGLLAGLIFGDHSRKSGAGIFAQATNPWELGQWITWNTGEFVGSRRALLIVEGLAILAVIGNTPRMLRGIREVIRLGDRGASRSAGT